MVLPVVRGVTGQWDVVLPVLVECDVTNGVCCCQWSLVLYQWSMVLPVERGITSGVWCNQWSMVLPVEYGITSGVWCNQWSVASPLAHVDLVGFDHL